VLSSLSDHDGHSPFWTNKQWAAWASLYDFHDRALAALGEADPFTEVMHGSRDIGHAWRACARRRITLQRTGYDLNDVDNSNGMLNTLHPLMEALGDAAERLVAWDGHGDVPEVQQWPHDHVPLGPGTSTSHKAWMTRYADEYEKRQHESREAKGAGSQGSSVGAVTAALT
jgi:hypothetical protein